ncbi:MAG: RNA polymerase sigma factor [Kiritimatiellae bacterium]|jgi:RNA polymerase sigma factor (sigma-70 family)|nr:RNA polymerase sigma factor [Kiritimatiellia bacterium]
MNWEHNIVNSQTTTDISIGMGAAELLKDIYGKRHLGDDDMRQIIRAYESCLLRYAQRFVNDHNSAEDVVQDTFIKLFRSWSSIKDRATNLKSWLYRVAHNQAVDLIRKEQNYRKAMENHGEDLLNKEDNSSDEARKQKKKELVLKQVDKLSPAEKEVLLLRLEEELSYKEISEITNRAVGNVGKLLHRAVGKITRELKTQGIIQ